MSNNSHAGILDPVQVEFSLCFWHHNSNLFFLYFTHSLSLLFYLCFYLHLQTMELSNFSNKKMSREERRYSVPHGPNTPLPPAASEDLHAWSIYR